MQDPSVAQPDVVNDEILLGRDFKKRPIGYISDYRPYRKTEILLGQVKQILEEYSEHLPLTVRQIYYRLVAGYRHPKGKEFYSSLTNHLSNARRAEEIPFDQIRDDGIMGGGWQGYDGIDGFHRAHESNVRHYYRNRQHDQPFRAEVWCESAGMVPQLQAVADPYSIPVYSSGGCNSLTAIRQIVDECAREPDGATVVLHLGDYDPTGVMIFDRVSTDVPEFLKVDGPGHSFEAVRVALTREQISELNLPMDEITTGDSRSLAWRKLGLTQKCELEALPPDKIAGLLAAAIEEHVCGDTLEGIHEAETRERAILEREVSEANRYRIGRAPRAKLKQLTEQEHRQRSHRPPPWCKAS